MTMHLLLLLRLLLLRSATLQRLLNWPDQLAPLLVVQLGVTATHGALT